MDVGTGKTATTIHILRHLFNQEKRILRTLIFCPPVVVKNWKNEAAKYSKIPQERILLMHEAGVKRVKNFERHLSQYQGNFLAVTNYHALQMKELYETLLLWKPEVLICDESHRLKNPQALWTKKMVPLADQAQHRFILTGTPVLNSPMDLFSQFRVLDGGATFGKNFFAFRAEYFFDKNAGMPKQKHFPNWLPKADTRERLGKKIEAKTFQAKKSECLTLPPLVRKRVEVDLSPKQKKAYDEMFKHFVTFVQESACVADLAITKTLRLQQIISGFIRFDDGTDHAFEELPRLQALGDILEDVTPSAKVIVWCNFKENYRQIGQLCERLRIGHSFLTGEQSTKEKDENVQAFETEDNVRVMIANPAAGGVGVNLIAASYMVYYTRNYSLEADIQSEARNYRGGSERHEKITRVDLVAPGTLDEVILAALEGKQDVAETILEFARRQGR
jgi:SNF2 family DNA or RNA helicase